MQKPRLPSTVNVSGTRGLSPAPVTIERQHYRRIQPPVHLDEDTKRFLTQLQDNVHEATLPSRSDPRLTKVIIQGVALTKGQQASIRHGLGVAFTGYSHTRAYSGSDPFAVVEAAGNGGQDPTLYVVLMPSCTGKYDLEIFGG